MAVAIEDQIISFNSTKVRSDAIIVTSSTIRELALKKLFMRVISYERQLETPILI